MSVVVTVLKMQFLTGAVVIMNYPNCQIKCNTFDLFLVIGLVNRSLAELPLPIDS